MELYVRYIFIIDVYVFGYFNVNLMQFVYLSQTISFILVWGLPVGRDSTASSSPFSSQTNFTNSHLNPQLFPQQPPSKSPVACQTRWENKSRNVPSVRTASNQTRDNVSEDVSDLVQSDFLGEFVFSSDSPLAWGGYQHS